MALRVDPIGLVKLRVAMASVLLNSDYNPAPGYIFLVDGNGVIIPVLTEASQAILIRSVVTEKMSTPEEGEHIVITGVEYLPTTNTPSLFSTIFGKKYSCAVRDVTAKFKSQTIRLTDGIYEALKNSWPIYATSEVMQEAGVTEDDLKASELLDQNDLNAWFQKLPPSSCHKA